MCCSGMQGCYCSGHLRLLPAPPGPGGLCLLPARPGRPQLALLAPCHITVCKATHLSLLAAKIQAGIELIIFLSLQLHRHETHSSSAGMELPAVLSLQNCGREGFQTLACLDFSSQNPSRYGAKNPFSLQLHRQRAVCSSAGMMLPAALQGQSFRKRRISDTCLLGFWQQLQS